MLPAGLDLVAIGDLYHVPVFDGTGEEPWFRGLKCGRLRLDDHGVPGLYGLVLRKLRHHVDADGVCCSGRVPRRSHRCPDFQCGCGYYAMNYTRRAVAEVTAEMARGSSVCVLDVEVGGRRLELELCWRAEAQRILSVAVHDHCRFRTADAGRRCAAPTAGAGLVPSHPDRLMSVCDYHRPLWSLPDLANLLGTEVSLWRPPLDTMGSAAERNGPSSVFHRSPTQG